MLKIAITGGIGSGKSTAAEEIKELGYKCFSADEVYKEMLADENYVRELSARMGVDPLDENGHCVLNKKAISELVFSDKSQLKKLNDFTHPKIMEQLFFEMNETAGEELVFAEVPLLFEGGYESMFDYVFIIRRSLEARTVQTMLRDGKDKGEVERVIKNQVDYKSIAMKENYIAIINNGTKEELKSELVAAIDEILKKRRLND